jgi:hypothetical protein
MVKSAQSFSVPRIEKAAKKRPTALGRDGCIPYVPMLDAIFAARTLPGIAPHRPPQGFRLIPKHT